MRRDALKRQDEVARFFNRNPSASARKASRKLGFSPPTVLKYMRALGIPVQAKPQRTRARIETDAREAAALFAAGKPLAEIGKEQGHSRVTVGRDLARLRVEHDRHSAPSRHRARERTRAQRRAESEALQAYCSRHNLWTVAQAADWLGRDYRTAGYYADRGRLAVAETLGPRGPGRVRLLRPRDVKMLGKKLSNTCETYFADFNDPVDFFGWLIDRGVGKARARELIARRQDAHERAALARPSAGRPKGKGVPSYYFEWLRLWEELAPVSHSHRCDYGECGRWATAHLRDAGATLGYYCDAHAPLFNVDLVEPLGPSKHQAALIVARAHPDPLGYSPDDDPDRARDTVRKAVEKALQIGRTEIQAA